MADLVTTIGLSDDQFQRTLRKLEGSVERSSRRMGRSINGSGGGPGGGGLGTALTNPGFVNPLSVTRRFVGVGSALALVGGAIGAVRQAAQQSPGGVPAFSGLASARGSFASSLGRDLIPAAGAGADAGDSALRMLSRLREGATDALGDYYRSLFTLSNQFGNATAVRDAERAGEIQARSTERMGAVFRARQRSEAAIARLSGRTGEAERLEIETRLSERLAEVTRERAAAVEAVKKAGLGALEAQEIASIDAAAEAMRRLARAERDAALAAEERSRARQQSVFDLAQQRLGASIAGDEAGVRSIDRQAEIERAQRDAEDRARALGQSPAQVGEAGRLARDEAGIRFQREDARAADDQRRALGISVQQLRVQQLTQENRRLLAIDLREEMDLSRFILEVNEQTAVSAQERADAIRQGTAAIRSQAETERQAERDRAAADQERKRDFSRSVEDRVLSLRASRLEAQGRRGEAAEIRKRLEIESITRDILRDETRTQAEKTRLIAEARREVEAFFEAQSRGGSRATGRGLDPGLGVFAGQVFGFGPGERGAPAPPAPVTQEDNKDLSEILVTVNRMAEHLRSLV